MSKATPDLNQNDFSTLAAPAQRALAGAGYTRLEQLAQVTQAEIANLHGVGPNALGKLKEAMSARGLRFKNQR